MVEEAAAAPAKWRSTLTISVTTVAIAGLLAGLLVARGDWLLERSWSRAAANVAWPVIRFGDAGRAGPGAALLSNVASRTPTPMPASLLVENDPATGDLATLQLGNGRLLVVRIIGEAAARPENCPATDQPHSEQDLLTCGSGKSGKSTLWKPPAPSLRQPPVPDGSL